MQTRQIVLDVETTGLDTKDGHRVIEIGCIELQDGCFTGNDFHVYLNPERAIDREALAVHGISSEFLASKPMFAAVAPEFFDYIKDSTIIAHNAPFDIGFVKYEFSLLPQKIIFTQHIRKVIDTLTLARKLHPGQRNTLDALCKRYKVDSTARNFHGAILDARLLAEVYLAMMRSQAASAQMELEEEISPIVAVAENTETITAPIGNITQHKNRKLKVIAANPDELAQHQAYLNKLKVKNEKS